ncbi:hypothetical protein TNCV_4129861 [Trichonephila clavipes]|nr:hypothetical protein TNCV_4129861 [Trichonephila clavipes]
MNIWTRLKRKAIRLHPAILSQVREVSETQILAPHTDAPVGHFRCAYPCKFCLLRGHYGRLALSVFGKVIRTPKILFQMLAPHSKTHTGVTFDNPACTPSVARGNGNMDVGLEYKAFPLIACNILQKLRVSEVSDSRSPF